MLNQNRITLEDFEKPEELVIASYEVGEKSKRLTVGLYINPKNSKIEGYKFFVYQGEGTVLGVEHLNLAIERYNSIKIEPEVTVPAEVVGPAEGEEVTDRV